jgi:hypothetical protein
MYISLSLYGQAYLKKLDKAKAAALAAKTKHKQAQGSSTTTQGKQHATQKLPPPQCQYADGC